MRIAHQPARGLYAVSTEPATEGERRVTVHLRRRNDAFVRAALALPGCGSAMWLYGWGPNESIRLPNRLNGVAKALVGALAEMAGPGARVPTLYWGVGRTPSATEPIGPSPRDPAARGITADEAFDHRVVFRGPTDSAWGRERRLAPALRQLLDGGAPDDPWGELGPLEDAPDRCAVFLSDGPLGDMEEVLAYSGELTHRELGGVSARRTGLCLVTIADPLPAAHSEAFRAEGLGGLWTVGRAEHSDGVVRLVRDLILPQDDDGRRLEAEILEILDGGAIGPCVWRGELARTVEFRLDREAEAFEIRPANREPIRQPVRAPRGPW